MGVWKKSKFMREGEVARLSRTAGAIDVFHTPKPWNELAEN